MDIYPTASVIQPLVFQDYSAQDTFAGIASSLKALLTTTDEVFGRIETRAAHERARLASLNTRLARCREKVRLVGNTARAVTLYAVPKFPGTEVARHGMYITMHDGVHHPHPDVDDRSGLAPIGANPLEKADMQPDDEVLTRSDRRAGVIALLAKVSLVKRPLAETAAGLGQLPAYLPSVCSTLLFNSKQRPYTAQKTLEELITREDEYAADELMGGGHSGAGGGRSQQRTGGGGASGGARRAAPGSASKKDDSTSGGGGGRKLGSAPKTLTEGDTLPALAPVEYAYRPKMKDIGGFALPSNLALPNVADISWQAAMTSIAPTVVRAEQPQLPTVLDLMPPPPPPTAATIVSISSLPALPPPDVVLALPPIPGQNPPPSSYNNDNISLPPPPSFSQQQQQQQQSQLQTPSSSSSSNSMMPPPPPPPSLSVAATPARPSPESQISPPASEPSGNRGGLLAALSNPENMKKLRKTEKTDEGGGGSSSSSSSGAPPPAPKAPAAPAPMSMLDEMANKLALRRKAMAGDAAAAGGGGGGGGGGGAKPSLPPVSNVAQSPARPALLGAGGGGSNESGGGGSTGIFKPESMHGFKLSTAGKSKKKRKDSDDDDWGSDSDDD